jgi:hypothetical protein
MRLQLVGVQRHREARRLLRWLVLACITTQMNERKKKK